MNPSIRKAGISLVALASVCFAQYACAEPNTGLTFQDLFEGNRDSIQPLYAKYQSCKKELNDREYRRLTNECLRENPRSSSWDCEGTAEEALSILVDRARLKTDCGKYEPTFYRSSKRMGSFVGSLAALYAIEDKEYEVAQSALAECAAVNDRDCFYLLGFMKFYGFGTSENRDEARTILRSAEKHGSKEAREFLCEARN